MSSCDICGGRGSLRAVVEGAEINVCPRCSKYGKVLAPQRQFQNRQVAAQPEVEFVASYGKFITDARVAAGLSLHELANKLNIREKDLLHFEEQKAKPTEKEAQKLSAVLKIKLIKQLETVEPIVKKTTSRELTLGDVVVIKDKRGKGN